MAKRSESTLTKIRVRKGQEVKDINKLLEETPIQRLEFSKIQKRLQEEREKEALRDAYRTGQWKSLINLGLKISFSVFVICVTASVIATYAIAFDQFFASPPELKWLITKTLEYAFVGIITTIIVDKANSLYS